jgi:glycosyltransferase involved in cell wall biosynthesis
MKILFAHNYYQQRGGEDAVVAAEVRMLEARGHRVVRYQRDNDEFKERSLLSTLKAGIDTLYSVQSFRDVKQLIHTEKPDVAHFHNTFPLISPAAYYACAEAGVPVVQALHNYRLVCPAATFFRNGKVCEDCLGRGIAWPGIAHGCYRGSRSATAAAAAMLTGHRIAGTWREAVNLYIALTEFARRKFIEGGLPADRIVVKPNFVEPAPGLKQGPGEYALFAGRLADEKGVDVLLEAWSRLRGAIPLRIAGEGPLKNSIAEKIRKDRIKGVELLGHLEHNALIQMLQRARFLILPSVWHEGFPLVIVEAFACGVPVIASRLAAMQEIIADGETGLHFSVHDPADLATKAKWAWNHTEEVAAFGLRARLEFEQKYSARQNYTSLMAIYNHVIGGVGSSEEAAKAGIDADELLEEKGEQLICKTQR